MCTESEDLNNLDWFEIVCRGMAVKINIIQSDPFEQGLRSVLNLGHTLGHAVEQVSEYKLKHGEAVSIGIVAASRLSEYLGIAEMGLTNQIQMALNKVGLPTEIPEEINIQQVITSMRFDKKRKGGALRFVLPVRIGNVNWGIVVDDLSPIIPA
jgi:3-dehydroquinate synthetase